MFKLKSVKSVSVLTCAAVLSTTCVMATFTNRVNAATKLKPVELSWYFIGTGQQKDTDLVEKKIDEYLKNKINATVKMQCFDYGSYPNKLQTMIAAGETFDICFTASWANNYFDNAAKGAFLALNDSKGKYGNLFDKYAPKTKKLLGSLFLKGTEVKGLNYAVPCNKEKAHNWGFIIRKDLAQKYKMDLSKIKKFTDIEPFLKTIKEKEKGVYPLEALNGESPFKVLDFDRVGDDFYPGVLWNDSKDLKVFNEFTVKQTKDMFNTMRKYFKAGYIRQDAASVTDFAADENAGKIFAAIKSLKPGKDAEMTLSSGHPWVQVDLTDPIISNRDVSGSMMAISRTSKNPERAMMFLELLNTDKTLNNIVNFGVEGTHYIKVGANTIKAGPKQKDYNPGIQWVFGNQFLNYLFTNEDPNKWAKFEKYNAAAKGTSSLGFNYNPAKVKTQIANCINVWHKYVPALETGSVDPNQYLPKLISEFKAAGADKIIADKQEQLNKWKASK